MKKFLEEFRIGFKMLAIVSGIGVSLYWIEFNGLINTIIFFITSVALSILLKFILRKMDRKKGETYSLSLTHGTPCALSEAEPGFFLFGDTLCYKNEYNESFIISSGEIFWGGAHTADSRDALMIVPLNEMKQ